PARATVPCEVDRSGHSEPGRGSHGYAEILRDALGAEARLLDASVVELHRHVPVAEAMEGKRTQGLQPADLVAEHLPCIVQADSRVLLPRQGLRSSKAFHTPGGPQRLGPGGIHVAST